jgi:pSer/pThr/pTyr-binding forkhead associated (FHA) protein
VYIVAVEDERGKLVSEHTLTDDGARLHIGRTPENDIVLASETVSRLHARLRLDGLRALVADMDSANGVLIDGEPIVEEAEISERNIVRIGEFRIYLERATGRMRPAQDAISTAIVTPDQAHGKLVVVEGHQAGREYHLFEPVISVGRTEENDVPIADASVSRHHARLKRQDDGAYVLTDLGSSNGTFVNDRPVTAPAQAFHGDRLRFGSVEALLVDAAGRGGGGGATRERPAWMIYAALVASAALVGGLLGWLFL